MLGDADDVAEHGELDVCNWDEMEVENMTTVYIENVMYIVSNEDGDVVADMDRDAAIIRMQDDYGGALLRVETFSVKVPRPGNYISSAIRWSEDGSPIVPPKLSRVGDPPMVIEATGELENLPSAGTGA